MDTIKKKINLEQYRNRFNQENWGGINKDYTISDNDLLDIKKNIPLVNENILRYRTMLNLLSWVKDFFSTLSVNVLCKRADKPKYVKEEANISKVLDILEHKTVFLGKNTGLKEVCVVLQNGCYAEEVNGDIIDCDNCDTSITTIETYKTNGFMGTYETRYIPIQGSINNGITYGNYVIVSPEMENFVKIFTKPETVETPLKIFQRAKKFIDFAEEKKGKEGTEIGYIPLGIYLEEDIKDLGKYIPIDEIGEDETTKEVVAIAESKLFSLKRAKKDYDDNGNELPFIVDYVNGQYVANIPYAVKQICNLIKVDDDTYYCDYLERTGITEEGKFMFVYYVGRELDREFAVKNSGIKYEEEYPCESKEYTCNYTVPTERGSRSRTFTYWDIDYDSQKDAKGKIMSKITYNATADFPDEPRFIRNESMIGAWDIIEDIGDIKIERGKSAAFEMHNVLGEISTFEDLSNYRNGFFKLKSEENN